MSLSFIQSTFGRLDSVHRPKTVLQPIQPTILTTVCCCLENPFDGGLQAFFDHARIYWLDQNEQLFAHLIGNFQINFASIVNRVIKISVWTMVILVYTTKYRISSRKNHSNQGNLKKITILPLWFKLSHRPFFLKSEKVFFLALFIKFDSLHYAQN